MPSHRACHVHVLWAESERYKRPNVIVAYSSSLHEAMPEEFDERIEEAKRWFADFGDESDGPWTFWTTVEAIPEAEKPEEEGDW